MIKRDLEFWPMKLSDVGPEIFGRGLDEALSRIPPFDPASWQAEHEARAAAWRAGHSPRRCDFTAEVLKLRHVLGEPVALVVCSGAWLFGEHGTGHVQREGGVLVSGIDIVERR